MPILDITATVEKRDTMVEVVRRTAKGITVPLAVGGGISSIQGIEELLDAGASKASINTAAVRDPDFVAEAVKESTVCALARALDGDIDRAAE